MSVPSLPNGGHHDFADLFDMISSPLFNEPDHSNINTEALSFTVPLTTSTQTTRSTPLELASCSTLTSTPPEPSPPVSSKRKHSEVEKDRRRSISEGFTMLQNVLHNDGDFQAKPISKSVLLKQACDEIRELRRKLDASTAIISRLRLEDVLPIQRNVLSQRASGERMSSNGEAIIPIRKDKRSKDSDDSSSVTPSDEESKASTDDSDPATYQSESRKFRASARDRDDAGPCGRGKPSRAPLSSSNSSRSNFVSTPLRNSADLQHAILTLLLELPHRMEEREGDEQANIEVRNKKRRR